jgi:hypothetical protein
MDNFDLKKYLAEGKLLKEGTGVDMILSPDQIKRYARMKTVGNISDPKLISKVIEIISDILPQNPNISKEELANQFGEDVVQRTTQILFSAYLDGYSDKAGNLPLVKDYISIFTQMADDERDEELAEGRLFKEDYKLLDENMGIEAKAWLVDDEDGLPKIIRFSSVEDAKENQFDEMADYPYNRPLFTSLEDLKTYLDAQYMYDYDIEKYRYV